VEYLAIGASARGIHFSFLFSLRFGEIFGDVVDFDSPWHWIFNIVGRKIA